MKLLPGFSIEHNTPCLMHSLHKSWVWFYRRLAEATLAECNGDKVGSPLGIWSVRRIGGLYLPLRLMKRAQLAVPQGGAKCTYTQPGSWMIDWRKRKLCSSERSNCTTGATSLEEIAWSTPKESLNPSCRIAAVRRLVPEKTSTQKRSKEFFPLHLADSLASKDACARGGSIVAWLHDGLWTVKLWFLPHPGSAHTWAPRWHHVKWPANSFAICCFQGFPHQFTRHVWASALSLAFSFALAFRLVVGRLVRSCWLSSIVPLALVGIVGVCLNWHWVLTQLWQVLSPAAKCHQLLVSAMSTFLPNARRLICQLEALGWWKRFYSLEVDLPANDWGAPHGNCSLSHRTPSQLISRRREPCDEKLGRVPILCECCRSDRWVFLLQWGIRCRGPTASKASFGVARFALW